MTVHLTYEMATEAWRRELLQARPGGVVRVPNIQTAITTIYFAPATADDYQRALAGAPNVESGPFGRMKIIADDDNVERIWKAVCDVARGI